MTTFWTLPTTITQYAEDPLHIEWDTNFDKVTTLFSGVSLSKPIQHISRQPKNDIKMKTWYIQATNFNFQNLPDTISGIAFRFNVNRGGRVFDDTVQLTHNGELIGENKCSRTVDPVQIYGSNTDLWTVTNIQDIIQDSSFGIVIRLRSHPDWPHKTTPILRGLELHIY
jgi:hypothetical protein